MLPAEARNWTPEERERAQAKLRDPMWTIPHFGQVKRENDKPGPADWANVDDSLEREIACFVADVSDEQHDADGATTEWAVVLKPRQSTRSTNFELAGLGLIMDRPGWDHVCIADTDGRAQYLHERIHYSYDRWDKRYRTPKLTNKERQQLTLEPELGGKARTMSAREANAGLGQTPNSFHWSEVGYCPEAATTWRDIYPSMAQRYNAKAVFECTPTEAQSEWHEMCLDAQKEGGRFRYFFASWQMSRLARRPWPKGEKPDSEEAQLLERYGRGTHPLTLDHLAFRRESLANVREYRENPDLFFMHYPPDDLVCWMSRAKAAIPGRILQRHLQRILVPWTLDGLEVYENPDARAVYVMGVDPAGFSANDHAAFHIFRANRGSEAQVACFADHVDSIRAADEAMRVGERFGWPLLVCENNGVGHGFLTSMIERGYPNIWYGPEGNPGWNNNQKSYAEARSHLLDLLDSPSFVIRDKDTVSQLQSYRDDRLVAQTESASVLSQLRGGKSGGRRAKHHWDKASALFSVALGIRSRSWPSLTTGADVRSRIEAPSDWNNMSFADRNRYHREVRMLRGKGEQRPGFVRRTFKR